MNYTSLIIYIQGIELSVQLPQNVRHNIPARILGSCLPEIAIPDFRCPQKQPRNEPAFDCRGHEHMGVYDHDTSTEGTGGSLHPFFRTAGTVPWRLARSPLGLHLSQ
jgi:hypothetical protein